jgi:sulfate adenylyltransferase
LTTSLDINAAHGGTLVHRIATPEQRQAFLEARETMPRLTLDERAVSDLVMIAIGGFSPLEGFLGRADYDTVVTDMRLANG